MDNSNKGDLIRRTIERLEHLTGEDFHGYRMEVWSVISDVIKECEVNFDCQMQIEGDVICQNQCNHCAQCYKKIDNTQPPNIIGSLHQLVWDGFLTAQYQDEHWHDEDTCDLIVKKLKGESPIQYAHNDEYYKQIDSN